MYREAVPAAHRHLKGASARKGTDHHGPAAVATGAGRNAHIMKLDDDVLAGIGPAPNFQSGIALQDHVIANQPRQANLRTRGIEHKHADNGERGDRIRSPHPCAAARLKGFVRHLACVSLTSWPRLPYL